MSSFLIAVDYYVVLYLFNVHIYGCAHGEVGEQTLGISSVTIWVSGIWLRLGGFPESSLTHQAISLDLLFTPDYYLYKLHPFLFVKFYSDCYSHSIHDLVIWVFFALLVLAYLEIC